MKHNQSLWTSDQDEYLKNNYSSKSMKDLITVLGKGKSTIFKRASELGVYKLNKWSEEELKILGEYYLVSPKTCKVMLPNRTTYAIRRMAANVGIALYPIGYPPRKATNKIQFWTEAEDQILIDKSQELSPKQIFDCHFKTKRKKKRTYRAVVARIRYLTLKRKISSKKVTIKKVEVNRSDVMALSSYRLFQDNKKVNKNRHYDDDDDDSFYL